MEEQFDEFSKLTTKAEKDDFHRKWNEKYLKKTPEEQVWDDEKAFECLDAMSARIDEMISIVKLGEVAKVISLSYVAKKYFGKTRTWLYQRINGNIVNGKPARFTDKERIRLSEALQDISCLIENTALKIA